MRRSGAELALALALALAACRAEPPAPAAASGARADAPAAPAATVRNVDAANAAEWLRLHPETSILDVRTPEEHAEAHLAGSTLLDVKAEGFDEKIERLDKSKTWLVYCRSGRRSGQARDRMVASGFQSIVHLEGGIEAWQAAGLPVEPSN